ncbi:MAG: recombinase family protein, partial [Sulfitobacter sp.]|nr:recombinase family protein [Sulfitobacter sp.]
MTARVTAAHRQRRAYIYVRQSTPGQLSNHVESTQRQYGLADRAAALGWTPQLIEVVDDDQGLSGSSADERSGFGRIAYDVAHGKAGAIFALEVSRLARSSQDWQRLLALCAVAEVLVIDESSVYDPGQHDDKLLLDIKGAMSEQELHWLSLRLAGG